MIERVPSPFPLDGGRAGDGGDTLSGKPTHLSGSTARARRLRQAQTFPEKLIWEGVRKLKLNIRRQAPIGRYIVDFVHHESRLVIEIDGPLHQRPEAQAYDGVRTAWLESQGYRVLRFSTKRAVDDREAVLTEIRAAIAAPPSQPFPHQGGRALWRAREQWVRDGDL